MPDTLSSELKVSCGWIWKETLDLSTVIDSARLEYGRSLSDGAGADQASLVWHDQRSIAAGANDDLDLAGGLSNTIFGTAVTASFTRIKAIVVVNTSIIDGDKLRVGGGANPFAAPFAGNGSAQVEVGADSALLLSSKKDGWNVTAGSGDILRIHNPGVAPITYRIVILGV